MPSAKKRRWIEILLHLIFWAGIFYVLTSLDSSHIRVWARLGPNQDGMTMRDNYDDQPIAAYVYAMLGFLAALFYGNVFWIFRKVIRNKNSIVRLTIGAAWLMLVFGANFLIVGPLFDRANPAPHPPPLLISTTKGDTVFKSAQAFRPPQTFRPVQPGDPVPHPRYEAVSFIIHDWRQIQPVILFAFLVIEGMALAYFILKEWAKSELIQTQLQANQLSTEIKFLKSQVNPHFLFNTLNNLFSMAQDKGNDELADGISKLSGMMRYMLYDSNEESVPLSKEITYLEECITLNKLRYADEEVKIRFEHPVQVADIRIAPMLFIPFVENAFKHGVAIGQIAAIRIAIAVSGQQLIFSCVNTDYNFIRKMEMEISGIGLENVKRRLELVYPDKHRLRITKEDGKFMVNLEIDLS